MNWEPSSDLDCLDAIERHAETDEVFVLWRGKAALFVKGQEEIELVDMQSGTVYNVPRGVWHGLVASRDVSILIVEDRDTHVHGTEVRPLNGPERAQILAQMPDWASNSGGTKR